MDKLLKIEKQQRMLIEQISITKTLEDYQDSFVEEEITRNELLERLEALSKTHLSIKKLDNLETYLNHIYSDWNKVRKLF
jgi:phosphorylcholine metabolism protein LicD